MLIRTEAPADILPVDALLKSAFETEAEASLVMKLRENAKLTLALVACNDEGEVVGYVMFSPVSLEGEDLGWQGMAPVAVKEEYRNQGIAGDLIKEGLESLYQFGYSACVVLGDPAFYGRYGFKDSADFGFSCEWEVPEGAFRVAELEPGIFDGKKGLIQYSEEFAQV
ncbi:N-acetyltransferase [Vibrio sp. JC009]|uniref:GNAT family N-acetyltransferase n=1 Tax=Vibrio sp. JC009 TaxID=2912314 RepID=UPI0023AFB810|nr:N-acetyltransferase [Vibrio sp. JC009]WED21235.1 N-acetyltransferase [Vibrio sp. JC009]